MTSIYIANEDALSEAVLYRLVAEANQGLHIAVSVGRRGNGYLRSKFSQLCKTAAAIPVLLLTDLDKTPCAPELISDWCGGRVLPENMLFRVAVREIEAWLLADREGFARFSGIPKDKIPLDPEDLEDPKRALLNLVRHYGRRELRSDLLPSPGSRAKIGFGYNAVLSEFARSSWSVKRAIENADSLERTYRRLNELRQRHPRKASDS
jgi:hypothetical protein